MTRVSDEELAHFAADVERVADRAISDSYAVQAEFNCSAEDDAESQAGREDTERVLDLALRIAAELAESRGRKETEANDAT